MDIRAAGKRTGLEFDKSGDGSYNLIVSKRVEEEAESRQSNADLATEANAVRIMETDACLSIHHTTASYRTANGSLAIYGVNKKNCQYIMSSIWCRK